MMSDRQFRIWFFAACFALCPALGQDAAPTHSSMPTADRLDATAWWPTKGTFPAEQFAGPQSCARCHAGIAASQQQTAMFKALPRASDSPVLKQLKELSFFDDSFSYLLS